MFEHRILPGRASGAVLAILVSLLLFVPFAQARVHRVDPWQTLPTPLNDDPDGPPYAGATDVAIDGDSIIATFAVGDTQSAVLYRLDVNDNWVQIGPLATGNNPAGYAPQVTMKNSLALIRLDTRLFLFEKSGGNWIPRTLQSVPGGQLGGFAISGQRLILGTLDCASGSNATLLTPNASREWVVTGKITGAAGQCNSGPVDLDLNYDYASIHSKSDVVRAYRPNGTALEWVSAGSFTLPANAAGQAGPVVLQKSTAVAPGASVFRRSGSTWSRGADVVPVNRDDGAGEGAAPLFRDGTLLNIDDRHEWDGRAEPDIYVYSEPAPGVFSHVGVLRTGEMGAYAKDISHEWAVAATSEVFGRTALVVWRLREPLAAPEAIANNFQARDISGLQFSSGSQFSLGNTSAQVFLRQSSYTGQAAAVFAASDWPYYQRISAEAVTQGATNGGGVGLAVRYVDADNYYSLTLRNLGFGQYIVQLRKRVAGVETVLAEGPAPAEFLERRAHSLVVEGHRIIGDLGSTRVEAEDSSLEHGRAALLTDSAAAQFDNVYVAPTSPFTLYWRWYDGRNQDGPPLNYIGGLWEKDTEETTELRQTDTSGTAIAHVGVPVRDQSVAASMTLEQFAPTSTATAWFGLIARYQNPQNYYYLSVRSSNTLQIRKVVNGVTTVLAAMDRPVEAGTTHHYELRVIGNELHAFVDRVRYLSTVDDSLATSSYGISTYRTAARWRTLTIFQP